MYGYIVCTFKHIEDLDYRSTVQSAILNYVQFKAKGKRYIVEEHGEDGDNPHWNIFMEHKKPAHILQIFEKYYGTDYYVHGRTVTTRTVKSDIDASFIINGYLTKEKDFKIIYDGLTEDYKKEINQLYILHTHKTTPKDKVVKRFSRLTDTEFFNVLYDAFYPMYQKLLEQGDHEDMDITGVEFVEVVQKIGKDYNIQHLLTKLKTFYIQLRLSYGINTQKELLTYINGF